ncbi:MAG: transcription antitermination factor NusB [Bacteroidota bacterium]
MLNRRILRVKAMQALYGYFTALESLKEAKREELRKIHSLDPAKHDFAKKGLFEARKKQAVRLFNQNIFKDKVDTFEEVDEDVLSSVNDALQSLKDGLSKEARSRKNEMMKEARRIYDTYLKILVLPLEIEQREKLEKEKEERAYIAKRRKSFPFINDDLINHLKNSKILSKEVARERISWANEQEEIKIWYREQIRKAESLAPFFDSTQENPEGNVVMEFFKKGVFKNEMILSYLEANNLHWSENQPIIKSMIVKTIKSWQEGVGMELAELTKNGEDDFKFLEMLFSDIIEQNDFLEDLIQKRTKNWDVERIALTDRVILKLALVEMMNSPSIPVKVTINEAIEISKMYSTPKSKQFVNGVLDVLSNELTSKGKIRKSGRGLIDNK